MNGGEKEWGTSFLGVEQLRSPSDPPISYSHDLILTGRRVVKGEGPSDTLFSSILDLIARTSLTGKGYNFCFLERERKSTRLKDQKSNNNYYNIVCQHYCN